MSRSIRIEKMANGYEVECDDPTIVAENAKPKSNWRDPSVSFAFETIEGVCEFLKKHADTIFPEDNFDSAFAKAVKDAKAAKD